MAADNREKFRNLLDALAELDRGYGEKRAAILAEMSALVGGGEGTGPKVTRLKAAFSDLWERAYRQGPYQFDHPKDTPHLKRWLVGGFSEEEIAGRMLVYMRTADPFYVKARHPFAIFVKGFNSFVAAPVGAVTDDDRAAERERQQGMRGAP